MTARVIEPSGPRSARPGAMMESCMACGGEGRGCTLREALVTRPPRARARSLVALTTVISSKIIESTVATDHEILRPGPISSMSRAWQRHHAAQR